MTPERRQVVLVTLLLTLNRFNILLRSFHSYFHLFGYLFKINNFEQVSEQIKIGILMVLKFWKTSLKVLVIVIVALFSISRV